MSDIASITPAAAGYPGVSGVGGGLNGYGPTGPISRNAPSASPASATSISAANSTPALDPDNRISALVPAAGEDRVEVSSFARYLEQLRRLPEVRLDKVAAARQAISDGAYDEVDVLDVAIDRMSEEEGL